MPGPWWYHELVVQALFPACGVSTRACQQPAKLARLPAALALGGPRLTCRPQPRSLLVLSR